MPDFDVFSEILTVFSAMGIIWGIASLASIALFVLGGYAIYDMSKKLGISNPWLGFIPILQCFALGRIGEKYIKRDGKPSAKLGKWLLVLRIIEYVLVIVFLVILFIALFTIIANVDAAIEDDTELVMGMFSSLIAVIVLYFLLLAVAVTYCVIYYITLWRVFGIFDNKNATLYLVLSIFFSFLTPIFLLIIKNNNPVFDFNRIAEFSIETDSTVQ